MGKKIIYSNIIMAIELIAIVITGAISLIDVFVNCFGLVMHGHCVSSCCCCTFEHDEEPDNKPELVVSDSIRKMFTKK
jgi:hypothetical protein